MPETNRREFLKLAGLGAAAGALDSSIAKALAVVADVRTGTIKDVEHIIILMQENNSFDEYFGTLKGVRGYSDPRVARRPNGNPVWLQPAGAQHEAEAAPATTFGGLTAEPVIPPFRLDPLHTPAAHAPGSSPGAPTILGLTYRADLDHGWQLTQQAWNQGRWDSWVLTKTPLTMSYLTRQDIPFHYALADAFTVGDAYYCSLMGPTNPNRCYLWTGCVGNVAPFIQPDGSVNPGGVDGNGRGPVTGAGITVEAGTPQYLRWQTLPEVLQAAGISWKVYQDLAGETFNPDFGGGSSSAAWTSDFVGNYTDNPLLYFKQYAESEKTSPLFQNACTGTRISAATPQPDASQESWLHWAEGLFTRFKQDVQDGSLPKVSWILAPAGYTEHPAWPSNYGAWYLSRILDILTASPEVFSNTAFIVNYDENDGYFDHLVPPTPPQSTTGTDGASTVSTAYEIVTSSSPHGPIGLGVRVPLLVISPWSKGGYVNSEVFDHTSIIRFIEKRFDLPPLANISPWRRAVVGDLTSCFNFANPQAAASELPATSAYLPTAKELNGLQIPAYTPVSPEQVLLGVPRQETGIRPARALPYELNVRAEIARDGLTLHFINTGAATAVFQVRSSDLTHRVRNYTVGPGASLSGSWTLTDSYVITVHGPNGFLRRFKGSTHASATALKLETRYEKAGAGSLVLQLSGLPQYMKNLSLLDAYSGQRLTAHLDSHSAGFTHSWALDQFQGWYDVVVSNEQDSAFECRLAGHVETGRDSWSDPAMGGLVALKA